MATRNRYQSPGLIDQASTATQEKWRDVVIQWRSGQIDFCSLETSLYGLGASWKAAES